MKPARLLPVYVVLIVCSLSLPAMLPAQEAGDVIVKQGAITEDLYLAGSTVDVLADVEGDVVAAGLQVTIDNSVTGDVFAAGGNVAVRGRAGDDVHAAGGNVTISGAVADDLMAAGFRVWLAPTATVGGGAWLGGRSVHVAGKVGNGLRAAGDRVVITGEIAGDVNLYAQTIEIGPGAAVGGNLRYHSPNEARIASEANIAGAVTRERMRPSQEARERVRFVGQVARAGLYMSLLLTGIVLYLLFPAASVGAARTIHEAPWTSLGLGLAVLAATPLVIALLFASLFGIWLGFIAAALYLVALLAGFLTGIFYVGDRGLRLIGRGAAQQTKGWYVIAIVTALVAVWILRFVPVVGGLAVFALLVFGLGALTRYLWRRYAAAV